jgi:hypothetical protein
MKVKITAAEQARLQAQQTEILRHLPEGEISPADEIRRGYGKTHDLALVVERGGSRNHYSLFRHGVVRDRELDAGHIERSFWQNRVCTAVEILTAEQVREEYGGVPND